MSRIDDLIAELAPDGVQFRAVGEVTARSSSIKWINAGDDQFQYIDLSSVDRVTRKIGKTLTITAENAPSRAQQIVHAGDVIFATTRPAQMRWAVIPAEYDGQIASTGYCVLRPDTSAVLTNYLAHLLGADPFHQYIEANQVAGNYPSIADNRVRAYRIPVPPLEVQHEIVRVLDQFTQLEAELEAELEARTRQYDYYRELILTEVAVDAERVALGDLGRIVTGRTPKSSDNSAWGLEVDFVTPSDIKNGMKSVSGTTRQLSMAGAAAMVKMRIPAGSLLVTCIGADMGKTVINGRDCVTNQQINAIIPEAELHVGYVFHVLTAMRQQLRVQGEQGGGTLPLINKTAFSKIEIPLPTLARQEAVAGLLDEFDVLVNDLSVGLPAELRARRKQYEYYRDKLLTFEELPA